MMVVVPAGSSNFLCMLPVAVARLSSDGNVIRYVLPVLWMTSCFHIIERMDRNRDDAYVLGARTKL